MQLSDFQAPQVGLSMVSPTEGNLQYLPGLYDSELQRQDGLVSPSTIHFSSSTANSSHTVQNSATSSESPAHDPEVALFDLVSHLSC